MSIPLNDNGGVRMLVGGISCMAGGLVAHSTGKQETGRLGTQASKINELLGGRLRQVCRLFGVLLYSTGRCRPHVCAYAKPSLHTLIPSYIFKP